MAKSRGNYFDSLQISLKQSFQEISEKWSAYSKHPAWRRFKRYKRYFNELLKPFLCVLDDLPFVFFSAPITVGSFMLGPFLLVAAGYIVFINELWEGIEHLHKVIGKKGKGRNSLIAIFSGKILFSIAGLAFTSLVLAFTLTSMILASSIAAVGVPAMVTLIVATELAEKVYSYIHTKDKDVEEKDKARRKVVFASIFVGTGILITTFAVVSVLSGLGVISLGIIPSAVLIAIASTAFLIKLFQLIDERYDNKMTKYIERLFAGQTKDNALVNVPMVTLTDREINKEIPYLKKPDMDEPAAEKRENLSSREEKEEESSSESYISICSSDDESDVSLEEDSLSFSLSSSRK